MRPVVAVTLVLLAGCGSTDKPVGCVEAAQAALDREVEKAGGTPNRQVEQAVIALYNAREEGCDQ